MNNGDDENRLEVVARFQAELRALRQENARLRAALTEIASHELDKRWWPDIADHAIAQDCELAHDDLRAVAGKALEG